MTKGPEKKHAACDECRTRKLKCSGESPKCSRCLRENVNCVYSPQKPMGRPKKRYRTEIEEVTQDTQPSGATTSSSAESVPYSPNQYFEIPNFQPDVEVQQRLFTTPLDSGLYAEDPLEHNNGLDMQQPVISESLPIPTTTHMDSMSPFACGQAAFGQLPGLSSCACLSNMYLTLSSLQSLTSFTFPFTLTPLRQSLRLASEVVNCEYCPKDLFLSLQNTSLLNTLLISIGERFHRLLMAIEDEANRAQELGLRKRMRVGEQNPETGFMHSGLPSCPMSFEVELEASEWRRMARQAVKTDVMGKGGDGPTFLKVIEDLERRQMRWHEDPEMTNSRVHLFGAERVHDTSCKTEFECLRHLGICKEVIRNMMLDDQPQLV